jgi:hypothetical protein
VYDVNNTGTLTITDLVIIGNYVKLGDPLPTPRRQIRSVIRIGTTSGELRTTSVSALGNTGSTFVMKAENLSGELLNVKGISAKGGTIELLDVINGVRFPSTFVGSSDVNTLDDYEEGTFTPVVYGTTSAGVGTYTEQDGHYTKIGRVVHFNFNLWWTEHTGTGNLRVDGLPFVLSSSFPSTPVSIVGINLTYSGALLGLVSSGTNDIYLYTQSSNAGIPAVAMDSSARIIVSGSYMFKEEI